ncbi:ParB N-terminal domain-containing protein [Streptosporangium sp. NPDC001681]|uniref:ParB N-terminal domain-containing protein n=1 Tax=Streptosporangium sp. NPDC001681 TaxID=3154395 RepID=UPI00331C81B3
MPGLVVEQTYRIVEVDHLVPHPENPHHGDTQVIAESVKANGFYGAPLIQRSTMRILAGHHRIIAAREQGLAEVPALLLDVDDEAAVRIMLADNRTAEFGGYDDQVLADLLQSLPDLDGTGWSDDDLTELLDDLGGVEVVDDQPAAPRTPPVSEPGSASSSQPSSPPPDEEDDLEEEEDEDDGGQVDTSPAPRPKAGTTADLILTVTAAEHDELTDLLGKVRARDGEATTTQIIIAALRAHAA